MRLNLKINTSPATMRFTSQLPVLALTAMAAGVLRGQSPVRVLEFPAVANGPARPNDGPVAVNGQLYFMSDDGGVHDRGSFCRYDPATGALTVLHSFGATEDRNGTLVTLPSNPLATPAWHAPTQSFYLTCSRGGAGNNGALLRYNFVAGTMTTLVELSAGTGTTPRGPQGDPEVVDRGAAGLDIYFSVLNGGTSGTGFGGILKFNTSASTLTTVHSFTGGFTDGRQPFKGFTRVGDRLWFTTFGGGESGSTSQGQPVPNGAGWLGRLDLATDTVTMVYPLPLGDGSTVNPASNPVHHPALDSLFFTTAGTSREPGSLQWFRLTDSSLTTLVEMTGAPTTSGPFPDGRFLFGAPLIAGDWLYFATSQGGAIGGGTVSRWNLATDTLEKLADLDSGNGPNHGGEPRGAPALTFDGPTARLWFLCRQGGSADEGTLLVVDLPQFDAPQLVRSGAAWQLSASTVPGFLYTAEGSDDAALWQPAGPARAGTGGMLEFPVTPDGPRRFWRLRRGPVP